MAKKKGRISEGQTERYNERELQRKRELENVRQKERMRESYTEKENQRVLDRKRE